jgi:hypothetical protein
MGEAGRGTRYGVSYRRRFDPPKAAQVPPFAPATRYPLPAQNNLSLNVLSPRASWFSTPLMEIPITSAICA